MVVDRRVCWLFEPVSGHDPEVLRAHFSGWLHIDVVAAASARTVSVMRISPAATTVETLADTTPKR
jgi:hypothetical protein